MREIIAVLDMDERGMGKFFTCGGFCGARQKARSTGLKRREETREYKLRMLASSSFTASLQRPSRTPKFERIRERLGAT
jgi:hypothetical protein